MNAITNSLDYIKDTAIRSMQPCQFAVGTINGHQVEAMVVRGFRNAGAKRKPSIQWKVNGSVVAASKLQEILAA